MFFIQMAGFPGSGKSTLAQEIARRTGCIVIDHDVTKSALLAEGNEMDGRVSGKIVDFAYVEFYLSQGRCVILDSPCYYEEMVVRGKGIAEKYGATYKMIKCEVKDVEEVNTRLKTRNRLPSQIEQVDADVYWQMMQHQVSLHNTPMLLVDSQLPLYTYIESTLEFIKK